MIGHFIVAAITLFAIFVLFLVISRTLNNLINFFIKLEYLLQKEYDLKLEAMEVRRMMTEQAQNHEST
jgi:hypothetical protein